MPICPKCNNEYQPGTKECPDCHVSLVSELEPPSEQETPARQEPQWEKICPICLMEFIEEARECLFCKESLQENDGILISYFVLDRSSGHFLNEPKGGELKPPKDAVILCQADDVAEVGFIRSLLEQENIPCYIENADIMDKAGKIPIIVPRKDEQKARKAIAPYLDEEQPEHTVTIFETWDALEAEALRAFLDEHQISSFLESREFLDGAAGIQIKVAAEQAAVARKNITDYQESLSDAPLSPEELLPTLSSQGELFYRRGKTLFALGEYDGALMEFGRALGKKSDLADAYLGIGHVMRKKKDYAAALEHYRKGMALNPADPFAPYYIGLVLTYNRAGKRYGKGFPVQEALEAFERALSLRPRNVFALHRRGEIFEKTGQLDQALVEYGKILGINSKLQLVYKSLARIFTAKNKWKRAEEILKKLQRKYPEESNVYNLMGEFYLKSQSLDKAAQMFAQANNLLENADALTGWAEVCLAMGQREMAQEKLKRAMELDPEYERARKLQTRLM